MVLASPEGGAALPAALGGWMRLSGRSRAYSGLPFLACIQITILDGHDLGREEEARSISERFGIPLCASNDVHMH